MARRAGRGAIRKGNWKLFQWATLPGKTELYDLSKDRRTVGRESKAHSAFKLGVRTKIFL